MVPDELQGSGSIQNGLGQNTDNQHPHLVNGQSRGLLLEKEPQPDKEEMSKSGKEHVMMPTQPTACFIVVEADLAFAFFKEGFNGPTQTTEADELSYRRGAGRIAEVELNHRWVIEVTADDQ